MQNRLFKNMSHRITGVNRRQLFRQGGMFAAAAAVFRGASSSASAAPLEFGKNIYESIGVKPVINCKGTFTIISGSQTLPEVKQAMDEASRHYVHLDELMDGVGKRLAELTGAEWGIVTAGCAAGITNVTAACIAGSNPERMQRLPYLEGMKSEVIIPEYSRNVYDHATRMLGVKVITVKDKAAYEAAFNERGAEIICYTPEELAPTSIERVAIDELEGRVTAMLVTPYPPGIPLLIPGERFNRTIVQYLQFAREFNERFPGFETYIHGLADEVGPDGEKRYYVDCLIED